MTWPNLQGVGGWGAMLQDDMDSGIPKLAIIFEKSATNVLKTKKFTTITMTETQEQFENIFFYDLTNR